MWFSHCTESANKPTTAAEWQQIFKRFGIQLDSVNVGCCGMAGTYGHEAVNLDNSKNLYAMSWQQAIDQYAQAQVLISGYSCRSQVKRLSKFRAKHPLEAILDLIKRG